MIRRTSGCSQCFHLFNQERNQCTGIQDCFCFLIQICLIGRSTTFCYAKEFIFHAFGSFDVNLCGEVTFGIYLIVHIQRRILWVTQVLFSICFIYTQWKSFFVRISSPYLLSFFTVDNSSTSVLTERKYTFWSNFCVTQESQCHILIVFTCFRITQNLSNLFVVRTTKHEWYITKSCISHRSQTFFLNFQDRISFKLAYWYIVFCKQIILSCIFSLFKHGLILKRRCCHKFLILLRNVS